MGAGRPVSPLQELAADLCPWRVEERRTTHCGVTEVSDSRLARNARERVTAKAEGLCRFGLDALRRGGSRPLKPLGIVSLLSSAPRPARRALLSYITHPFLLPADHPDQLMFSNIGLARSIAQVLLDMGFDVDVINYDDVSFRSNKMYDLLVVHGGVNFETLHRNVSGDAKLVYYSTGCHWAFHNQAEISRFAALRERRGIDLPLDRYIRYSEQRANVLADGIICLGNHAVRETYSDFPTVISLNNAALADGFFDDLSKDYAAGRRGFLSFGSAGSVHKGLDLVLEAFVGLDAELYVCGAIEPEFRVAFARELALPNVHDMGWVRLRSARFYDLMRTCNCVVLPSASEGQPGGVVECMHRGLIPIVSRETNIDTDDFGVTLPECSVESIRATVTGVMTRPPAWHETASRRTYQVAATAFAPGVFLAQFREAVQRLLDLPGEPRRNTLKPKKTVSMDTVIDTSMAPARASFRVAIDAVFFQWNNTGIARVWDSLFREWSQNGFGSSVLVIDRDGTAPKYPGLSYIPVPAYPAGGSLESDRDMLEEVCRRHEAGLFISTYYTFPRRTASLAMVYDMIPEATGMNLRDRVWQRKHRAISHAVGHLAISASTAADLAKYFPEVTRESIVVAHCAAGQEFAPSTSAETLAFRREYGLPSSYYLFVGSRTGYKNCRLLLDAFATIDSPGQSALLLVGGAPLIEAEFAPLVKGRSILLAMLSDEDLRFAYGAATALVFPSRYEGFGLPVLEAMACGCPVITCSNSSIAEVAGDAAIYVDEANPDELAGAMLAVRDQDIRCQYIEAGLLRARDFSWPRMASVVQGEIEHVYKLVEFAHKDGRAC
jgi:glycosyltransferase involved in cell wall biosynthesis